MNLESIQNEIQKAGLDGWLFFDHHERDPLAYRVLGLKPPGHVSRRWYYFIPARGEPRGLVHQVEPQVLNPLPGAKIPYARWQEQEAGLRQLLRDATKVAMQYSPRCAVPYAPWSHQSNTRHWKEMRPIGGRNWRLRSLFAAEKRRQRLDGTCPANQKVVVECGGNVSPLERHSSPEKRAQGQ